MTAITTMLIGDASSAVPPTSGSVAAPTERDVLQSQLAEATQKAQDLEKMSKRKSEKIKQLKDDFAALELDNSRNTKENSRLTIRLDELRSSRERGERQRTELVREREYLKHLHTQKEEDVAKLQAALKEHTHVHAELEASQKAVAKLTHELQHLKLAHSNTESLLATRSAELREAQAFLDKSDAVSYGDVQRMLEHLNEQIFQLAALVTDRTPFGDGRLQDRELDAVHAKVARWLGCPIADMLAQASHAEDPTWAQVGLQAMAVELAAWIINAWDVGLDDGQGALLTNMHQLLFEKESQAISARWRVLSRRCAKELARPPADVVAEAAAHLLESLHCVLRLSGARALGTRKSWGAAFADKARDIVVQSLAVQKAIGEDVASADFQLICPSAAGAALFDESSMEDLNARKRDKLRKSRDSSLVLCTTDIGLRRCEKVEGQVNVAVVAKAKVILKDC
ncbi:hypothetical protein PsYK624_068220 [Phanerochaete sordida]|uniref:Uncharacterized protein n=1 Tax=Phanerochaete sordida TaxID=48140 RepID=A0A9P3G7E6_9APHY|nr:hypothetical protein PsYK624_068220 [Phanerochaete sordida]